MKKVLVIGCPGSGKSTFARALRERTGLPLYYLDCIWHRPDGSNISRKAFDARLQQLMDRDCWILDGNYLRTLEVRLQRCDTVFLLDYPLSVCLAGAAQRVGKPREDLPWVEKTFDPEFRRWIEDFPQQQLPQMYELLQRYREGRQIWVFHSREEAAQYLAGQNLSPNG